MTSTAAVGTVRLCPVCKVAYMLPNDFHASCQTCLGARHAELAMRDPSACGFCQRLSEEERQQRAEFFSSMEADTAEGWLTGSVPFADALRHFQCTDEDRDDGHESDGSAPSISGSPGSPLSLVGDLEAEAAEAPQGPSAAAEHIPAKTLLSDLPGIISAAATRKGMEVPAVERPPVTHDGFLGRYGRAPPARSFPLWPRVPALLPFAEAAFSKPGKLKAPVTRYEQFTRVQGLSEDGFPGVPRLEDSLASLLLPKAKFFGRRKPTPPSPQDESIARLSDRTHSCAIQTAAAANNIALLASSVFSLASQPGALPPEMATEIDKAMSAIMTLTTAQTVASARTMAFQVLTQRHLWLRMAQLPPPVRQELLDGPISTDGLFGPAYHTATAHLQAAADEAERFRRVTSWDRPPRSQRPQRAPSAAQSHRDNRHRRRPAAAAAGSSQQSFAEPFQRHRPQPAATSSRPAARGRQPAAGPAGPPTKRRRF